MVGIGRSELLRKPSEIKNQQFRRSLYFVKNMKAGELMTEACIRSVRPGFGVSPKYLNEVIGHRVACEVKANSPVTKVVLGIGRRRV